MAAAFFMLSILAGTAIGAVCAGIFLLMNHAGFFAGRFHVVINGAYNRAFAWNVCVSMMMIGAMLGAVVGAMARIMVRWELEYQGFTTAVNDLQCTLSGFSPVIV